MGAYRIGQNGRMYWDTTVDQLPDGSFVPAGQSTQRRTETAPSSQSSQSPSAGNQLGNAAVNAGINYGLNYLGGGGAAAAIISYLTYKNRKAAEKQYGTRLTEDEMMKSAPIIGATTKIPIVKTALHYDPSFRLDKMLWGSTKSDDQLRRDRSRQLLKKSGVIDDKYQLHFSDGSSFDMGMDGGARLKNADGTERRYNEVDSTDSRFKTPDGKDQMGDIVAMASPLGYIASINSGAKEDQKTPVAMTGYFTNAATSNSKNYEEAYQKLKETAAKMNITQDNYTDYLDKLKEAGKINDDQYNIYKVKLQMIAAPGEAQQAPQEENKPRYSYSIPPLKAPKKEKVDQNWHPYLFGYAPGTTAQQSVNQYQGMLNQMAQARKK